MIPVHTTVSQILEDLGITEEETIQTFNLAYRRALDGVLGYKTSGALCFDDKGEIAFLEFEKISETQVSSLLFEPQISREDQAAILQHISTSSSSARELLMLVALAKELRDGVEGNYLLDGSPPTQMVIEEDQLVFRPLEQPAS